MESGERNYYELLGVTSDATVDQIKEAYREIARIYHPDSNFYSEIVGAELSSFGQDSELFKEITAAYNTLTNEERRREYDSTLHSLFAGWEEAEAGRSQAKEDIPEEWKREREYFEQHYFEILKPGPKINLTSTNGDAAGQSEDHACLSLDTWEDQGSETSTVFGDLSVPEEEQQQLIKELPHSRRPAHDMRFDWFYDPFNLVTFIGIPVLLVVVIVELFVFL